MSAAADGDGGAPPKSVDACNFLEGQLLINPNKVLLRRIFFLDTEKTKYISVGFYPARHYQPLVEIGSPKSAPVILTNQHVKTLSEHQPAQIDALWRGFLQRDGWRICHALGIPLQHRHIDRGQEDESQIRAHQTERLTLSLLHIPHGGESAHQIYRSGARRKVLYTTILDSTSYADPPANASNNILYYQLYEELKMIM